MNDPDILKLFRERNEEALRQTEAKYRKICMTVAKNILSSEDDAAECVNDTLLAAWNAIPPAAPRSLCAFLCGITRNLSLKRLDYQRAAKRNLSLTVSLTDLEDLLPASTTDSLSPEELGRLLSAFLKTESAQARTVFLRRYWFFDSILDIARNYGHSESKVKSMLFHTRNRLKAYLRKEGYEV